MSDRVVISWNERVVGWIRQPRLDFPHFYGRWVSAEGEAASLFLSALRLAVDDDDGLEVVVDGKTAAVVYVHPNDEDGDIDVRLR